MPYEDSPRNELRQLLGIVVLESVGPLLPEEEPFEGHVSVMPGFGPLRTACLGNDLLIGLNTVKQSRDGR